MKTYDFVDYVFDTLPFPTGAFNGKTRYEAFRERLMTLCTGIRHRLRRFANGTSNSKVLT